MYNCRRNLTSVLSRLGFDLWCHERIYIEQHAHMRTGYCLVLFWRASFRWRAEAEIVWRIMQLLWSMNLDEIPSSSSSSYDLKAIWCCRWWCCSSLADEDFLRMHASLVVRKFYQLAHFLGKQQLPTSQPIIAAAESDQFSTDLEENKQTQELLVDLFQFSMLSFGSLRALGSGSLISYKWEYHHEGQYVVQQRLREFCSTLEVNICVVKISQQTDTCRPAEVPKNSQWRRISVPGAHVLKFFCKLQGMNLRTRRLQWRLQEV